MANNRQLHDAEVAQFIGFSRFPTTSIPAALRMGSRFFWSIIVVVCSDET